jgi:hypothetical protein
VRHIILQGGRWCPDEAARVGNALSDVEKGCDVVARPTKQGERHGARSSRLPGDGIWLANRNLLTKAWERNWVTRRAL